ncbi:MAG TPA: glycine cleavage system aminomethyltransferase GcvT [Nitrososphaerales archaeon]|nr:glycine cleavage system aminomethyltransferase GcvT [Nitrososphaerales archaeon]
MATKANNRTPLYEFHRTHGKMVEFAGYDMPIWYTSTMEEHMAVRNRAGIFDVSHMGRVDVTGPDAAKFIESLFPTGIGKQPNGKSVYTLLLNEDAGIVDDLIVLKVEDGKYLVVVNAATKEKDLRHMERVGSGLNFKVDDITEATTMIAVQGPSAVEALQPLTPLPLAEMKRFTHAFSTVKGIKSVITRTGYTGEDGFEIIVHDASSGAMAVWEALMTGATPCALGARDSLRLEAGLPLYGSDMDETTNPLEADLGWAVSKEKSSYVGWESLSSLAQRGPARVRRGIVMDERIPRHGFKVTDKAGEEIGVVTSGTFSPVLKRGIAMGYVKTPSPQFGDGVMVVVRDDPSNGKIAKFPVYDDSMYGWKRKQHQQ